MKVALVELEVEYGRELGQIADSNVATPMAIVTRADDRCARVEAAVADAAGEGANIIVLPLWTLPPSSSLDRLLRLSKGVTMVGEIMGSSAVGVRGKGVRGGVGRTPNRAFVLQDGRVLASGIAQSFATASEINGHEGLSPLDSAARWVPLPDGSKLFLLLCGESNARRNLDHWNQGALRLGFDSVPWFDVRAILNPAHSVPSVGRMLNKWRGLASLTSGRRLYHTANLHPRAGQVARAGLRAAYIVTDRTFLRPDPVVSRNGYTIRLDTLP